MSLSAMLLTDLATVRRLEANDALNAAGYAAVRAQLYPGCDAEALPVAGGYAVRMGLGFPINRAVGLGLAGPVTAADLDRLEAHYAAGGLPAEVEVCPLADGTLVGLLAERGYRLARFYNIHARHLVPADAHPALCPAISVEPTDPENWALAVARAFLGCDTVDPGDPVVILSRIAAQRPGTTVYVARLDGQIVGAGGLSVRDGLATLFSTTTHPAFRRRGVQCTLIGARLAAAAAAGCETVMAMTIPGSDSQRNLERAGLVVRYTKTVLMRKST